MPISKFESANAPTKTIITSIKSGTPDYAVSSVYLAIFITLFFGAFGAFFVGYVNLAVADGQSCFSLRECDPKHLSFVADLSLRMYLEAAAILSTAAIVTALRRRAMVEARNWEPWSFNQPPTPRLVRAALVPAALGVLAIAVVLYIERVYDNLVRYLPPFDIDIGKLVALNVSFLVVAPIVAFLTSLCVLVVADMHTRLSWYKSLIVSLAFVLLILLSALAVFAIANRFDKDATMPAALDYLLLSTIFLGAFAVWIERSEVPSPQPEPGTPS